MGVEAVAFDLAGAGWDRCGAQMRPVSLQSQPLGVVADVVVQITAPTYPLSGPHGAEGATYQDHLDEQANGRQMTMKGSLTVFSRRA
jgi:hypothetical protein